MDKYRALYKDMLKEQALSKQASMEWLKDPEIWKRIGGGLLGAILGGALGGRRNLLLGLLGGGVTGAAIGDLLSNTSYIKQLIAQMRGNGNGNVTPVQSQQQQQATINTSVGAKGATPDKDSNLDGTLYGALSGAMISGVDSVKRNSSKAIKASTPSYDVNRLRIEMDNTPVRYNPAVAYAGSASRGPFGTPINVTPGRFSRGAQSVKRFIKTPSMKRFGVSTAIGAGVGWLLDNLKNDNRYE